MSRTPSSPWVKGLLVTLVLGVGSVPNAVAQDDPLAGPALATAENPSELTVATENPDSEVVATQSLSSLEGPTHPLPAPTATVDPSSLVAETVSPDSLEAHTFPQEPLPDAAVEERKARAVALRDAALQSPSFPPPQTLAQAQSQLVRARSRLAAANTAVGTMIRRDYPTGEARLRIYDEQRDARDAVEKTEGWVREFGGLPNEASAAYP